MEHTLPKGFHFTPSDEELLIHYLGNLERGLPLPSNAVIVRDLYDRNKSPWEILNNDDDPWEKKTATAQEKHVYVITELDKASDNRIRRTVGCGSWHESGGTEVYDNNNRCIGSKKTYAFEITSNDCLGMNNNGHWIMNELTATNSLTGGKYVICKISRDGSKPTKIAPPSRRNNHDVKNSSKGQGTKKRKIKRMGNNDDDDEAVGDGSHRKKMCHGHEEVGQQNDQQLSLVINEQNTSIGPNNGFDGLLGDGEFDELLGDGVENEDTWFSYGELLGDQGQQQPLMQEQDNYNYNPVISIWS